MFPGYFTPKTNASNCGSSGRRNDVQLSDGAGCFSSNSHFTIKATNQDLLEVPGVIGGDLIHNNSAVFSPGQIRSGVIFPPPIGATVNVTTLVFHNINYTVIGRIVTFTFEFEITVTVAAVPFSIVIGTAPFTFGGNNDDMNGMGVSLLQNPFTITGNGVDSMIIQGTITGAGAKPCKFNVSFLWT